MEKVITSPLRQILDALDDAIVSAIETPSSAGGKALVRAEEACRALVSTRGEPLPGHAATKVKPGGELDGEILWEIRARVGRLKLLLDTAAAFYQGLTRSPAEGMDYDMQGELTDRSTGRFLQINC